MRLPTTATEMCSGTVNKHAKLSSELRAFWDEVQYSHSSLVGL